VAAQEAEHIHVAIDVKPGEFPNVINLKSHGVVPVALFGSATFSVRNVKLDTVGLHAIGREGEAVPPARFVFAFVNCDRYLDILFFFRTQSLPLTTADTAVCLHGDLKVPVDGLSHWCGEDTVIVKKK